MGTAACRLVLVVLALLLGWSPALAAGGKVALVIGNSSYRHATALKNPVNDARAFAGLLERMGFASVSLELDQDYGGMRRAIRDFAVAAEGAEIAIIYYAGHGMEMGGENYLVPVDARLERDQDLDYEAITLASVLKSVEGASRLRLVILDACRNNPLAASMRIASGQTRSVAQGLTSIEPPGDVLVAFAARHGTTAADGEGEHSPFTAALLRHFDEPGTDVRLVLGEVRDSVLEETKNRQEPHIYGTLGGSAIYLVPAGAAAAGDSEALCRVELERARAKGDRKRLAALAELFAAGECGAEAGRLLVELMAGEEADKTKAELAPTLWRRGVNIRMVLVYPQAEDWPFFRGPLANLSDAELKKLRDVGLDYLRLPVEVGVWLDRPRAERDLLEKRLTDFVAQANRAGLAVMVSLFPRSDTDRWQAAQIFDDIDGAPFKAYQELTREVAGLIGKDRNPLVALELANEPQAECSRPPERDWPRFQKRLYEDVRSVAAHLTVVLTGTCWSNIEGLEGLAMAGFDADTLVDVHFYEPFSFTHQGAPWVNAELLHVAGLSFPPRQTDREVVRKGIDNMLRARFTGSKAERRRLVGVAQREVEAYLADNFDEGRMAQSMKELADWARRNGLEPGRIVVGEIGGARVWPESGLADDGSRLRWHEAVRKAIEGEGFGWSLWAYDGDFGLLADESTRALDADLLAALGLSRP